jgi:DNA-directed RNA polymerase subunit RPC12/RpoP
MKCIQCGTDVKKQDRDARSGHCPNCNHTFVTEPTTDVLTDMLVKTAEDTVSGNGAFYFSAEQLEYQLERRFRKKGRVSGIIAKILFITFLIMLTGAIVVGEVFIFFTIVSAFAWLATFGINRQAKTALSRIHPVVQKWIMINPHPKLMQNKKHHFNTDNSHLEEVSFDRVLICDKNETVNFFLENLFHFHYSCPVLGGGGYPESLYADMLERLKKNPNLKVFLLHDCSPHGQAFVRKMKTDRNWFGDGQYQIIDLGLNIEQKEKLFKSMTRRQRSFSGKMKEIAELSLFKPAMLITLCGAAINEAVALDQVQLLESANQNQDGYG